MKTFAVQSKYADPDKYIAKLKVEVKRLQETGNNLHRDWLKEMGQLAIRWQPHEKTQESESGRLSQFNPGDKIAIIGTVVEVSCRNSRSRIVYTVKETRIKEKAK